MDHDALFPLAPINAAEEKLQSLFSSANDALASLTKHFEQQCLPSQSLNGDSASASDTADRQRLHATVERLQAELGVLSLGNRHDKTDRSPEEKDVQYKSQAAELHTLLGQIREQSSTQDPHIIGSEQERERLDQIKKELEDERAKFTEASVKLGRERAALEVSVRVIIISSIPS